MKKTVLGKVSGPASNQNACAPDEVSRKKKMNWGTTAKTGKSPGGDITGQKGIKLNLESL